MISNRLHFVGKLPTDSRNKITDMRSSNELFEELQIECETNQTFRDLKPAERLSLRDNLER